MLCHLLAPYIQLESSCTNIHYSIMSDEDSQKESANREAKPYRAEYAVSNRAKCKLCNANIEKNSLKLAIMVKSRFHDGYDPKHHHVKCFFQVRRPKSVAEIGNFSTIKFEDQKMLEKALETNGGSVLVPSDSGKKGKKRSQLANDGTNYSDFTIELAKSSRSTCHSCQEKIAKDLVRVGILNLDIDMNAAYAATGPVYK